MVRNFSKAWPQGSETNSTLTPGLAASNSAICFLRNSVRGGLVITSTIFRVESASAPPAEIASPATVASMTVSFFMFKTPILNPLFSGFFEGLGDIRPEILDTFQSDIEADGSGADAEARHRIQSRRLLQRRLGRYDQALMPTPADADAEIFQRVDEHGNVDVLGNLEREQSA